ncbi:MAG: FAD:protein FMN transferase, partial [Parasporobacterium sp.]|nr:FAD:protein FMN transferase [Parasporobacterium sp.]
MIMYGTKPDGKEFNIGLQKPWAETGIWEYSFKGSDIAMSVSGPYERYFEENGTIYHHIVDPATGCPADTDLNGACIIGKNALQTDILSTAVFLMGADAGLEYIENIKGVECVLFDQDNNIILSSGLTMNDKTVSLKLNTAGF